MDARTKEAIRYLGYGRHAVDDHTLKLVESCFEELSQAACGRIVYRIFELEFPESGRILLGNLDIHSKNLYKNLTGCKKAVLLGATLGPKVDLLLREIFHRRYGKSGNTSGVCGCYAGRIFG